MVAFSFGPGPLGLLVVIVLLTTVGGRLLGIRLRWWRALLAGFPGLVAGIIFVWAQEGHPPSPRPLPAFDPLAATPPGNGRITPGVRAAASAARVAASRAASAVAPRSHRFPPISPSAQPPRRIQFSMRVRY